MYKRQGRRALAGELGAGLDYDTSQIFQRLDGQPDGRLMRVARQMGPQWDNTALEYGQLGVVALHRALGRRGEARRLQASAAPSPVIVAENAVASLDTCAINPAAFWVEGFGSFARRSDSKEISDYDGHFAGTVLGFEKSVSDWAFGAFGSWADYRADGGDGVSDGDWYTAGLYGGFSRGGFFLDASAAYNHASYDANRSVFIPGVIFTTPYPDRLIVLDPYDRGASSGKRMNGFSAGLGAGYDFEPGCGWSVGPRVEGSLVHSRVSGYSENGAGARNLSVSAYRRTYAGGGVGVGASKAFARADGRALVASFKLMGMYGSSFGDDLRGSFSNNGSAFRFKPERHSGLWCLPEASLTWKANDRIAVTAAYSGRFGKRYVENSGSLCVSLGL